MTRLALHLAISTVLLSVAGCQQLPGAPSPLLTTWTNPVPPPPPPPPPVPRLLYTRIMAFGDSMTEGDATTGATGFDAADCVIQPGPGLEKSYPFKLNALLSARYSEQTITVFNEGCGGERADVAAPRLTTMINQFRPEVLIIMHGANDLNQDQDAAVTGASQAIDQLIKLAQSMGVRVILSAMPMQNPNGTPPRGAAAHLIQPYNQRLLSVAVANQAHFANVFPVVTLDMLAPDGLHLTQAGNDALAAVYMDRIRDAFEAPIVIGGSGGA